MVEYTLMLFKDIPLQSLPNTSQVQIFFGVFGIVFTIIGYWLKGYLGAALGVCLIYGMYLYMTGFF